MRVRGGGRDFPETPLRKVPSPGTYQAATRHGGNHLPLEETAIHGDLIMGLLPTLPRSNHVFPMHHHI